MHQDAYIFRRIGTGMPQTADHINATIMTCGDSNNPSKLDADVKQLWESILGGNISVSTVTYAVNGKQYVAVMTGDNPKVPELSGEFPEMKTPRGHNSIYVFSLP